MSIIHLTRIIIFSAVLKVFLSILFENFSLSVQLNRAWNHHLSVMPVSITHWCVEIEIFYTRFSRVSKSKSVLLLWKYCTIVFCFVCCMALTLFTCGDVELNPRPKHTKSSYNFSKLSIIEAYNTHHNFDDMFLWNLFRFFLFRWWLTT